MTGASRSLLETPFVLAGKRLRNRIVHASMTTLRARNGGTTDAQIQYYANRAQGGAAMIVTEPLTWSSLHDVVHKTRAWSEAGVDGLKRWADAVESHDCRLLGQVQDPGRARHNVGRHLNAIAPSALPDDLSWSMPRALTVNEIRCLVADFALSAERLKRCGFSGVELSAGHGHLFHQFFSPRSNHRDDEYGGDWEGRTRFVRELVSEIRSVCGSDFIVGLKLPGDDGMEGSIGPPEAAVIAGLVTRSGEASYVCFAQGTHGRTLDMHVPDRHGRRMPYRELIRGLRTSIPGVPLVSLGRITDPAEAEGLLAAGEAELIGLGRALVADPAWPIKAARGRTNDIRYCISCNTCWDTIITRHEPMACVNNPRVAEPDEVDWWPSASPVCKRVVVVGSGVAGLEAAWIAAARGHAVTVLARAGAAGGKARLRTQLPGGEDSSSVYDYQLAAAQRAGVRFELGLDAGLDDILRLKPDTVVLATGATMVPPPWLPPEVAREGLVPDLRTAMQDLVGVKARQDGTAVLYDMDHSEGTYAAAERLAELFQRVVLITPRDSLADDTSLVTRQGILRRLAIMRVEMVLLSEPLWSDAFEQGKFTYRHVYSGETSAVEDVAFLSYSTPRVRNDQLWLPLRDAGIEVHRVGDCFSPRDLLAATADGHRVGNAI
jgi:2,4-dienoyl-CoA reductase-like NADH-dependent reductase (Old Yellow Enzyme family)